jgi:hypothetical protein
MRRLYQWLLYGYIALLPIMEVPQTLLLGKKIQYSELLFLGVLALFCYHVLKGVIKLRFDVVIVVLCTYVAAALFSGWGAGEALDKRRFILECLGIAYLATVFLVIFFTVLSEKSFKGIIDGLLASWYVGFAIVVIGIIIGFVQGYILKSNSIFLISYPAPTRYQLIHRFIPRIVSTLRSPDMMISYLIASFAFVPWWWNRCRAKAAKGLIAGMMIVSLIGAFLSTAHGIVGLLVCVFILSFLLKSARAVSFARAVLIVGIVNAAILFSVLTIFEPSKVHLAPSPAPGEKEVTVDFHVGNKYLYGKYALRMYKDHPLRGIGAGNFNARLPEYYAQDPHKDANFKDFVTYDPHNTHLGLLAEVGTFGWLSFLALFFIVAYALYKGLAGNIPSGTRLIFYGVLAALAGIFLQSPTMDIQNLRHLWIIAAFGYALYKSGLTRRSA